MSTDIDGTAAPTRAEDSGDPLIGRTLADRFKIQALVARGGMGKIYRAEQQPLGRIVALKVLAPSDRKDDEEASFRRRFEREAAICARLTHSNTVRIFDYGWTPEGVYYIAMEYIDGRTLHQVCKTDAPIAPGRVIHVSRQVAASLSEAHKLGIIHRDLKPGNVLLTTQNDDRDFVKVVDFGLVKHITDTEVTQAGLIVGSPMYMSPEQVRGEELDARSDIYALGMMMYVSLTGKRPFDRDTPIGVLMARMTHRPPPIAEIAPGVQVPASLEWVVMACLETDRKNRFESMHEVLRALKVCEAELRGDHGGSYKMSIDNGKTVLPPDFSDLSLISKTRPALAQPTTPPPDLSPPTATRAAAAGLSVLALGALVLLLFLAVGVGVGVAWVVGLGQTTTSTTPVQVTPAQVTPAQVTPGQVAPAQITATPPAVPVEPEPSAVTPAPGTEPAVPEPAVVADPATTPVTTPKPKPKPKPKPTATATTSTAAGASEPATTQTTGAATTPATTPPATTPEDTTWKGSSTDIRDPFKKTP